MSLKKVLKEEFIDAQEHGEIKDPTIRSVVQKLEERTDYELKEEFELYKVGYGSSADVFSVVGTGKVLRFADISDWGKHNLQQMERVVEKDFKHVVNYYFFKIIKGEYTDKEVSVLEKLERLEGDIKYTLQFIQNDYADGLYWFFKHVDIHDKDDIREALDRKNEELVRMIIEHKDLLDGIYTGIRELESVGIRHKDLRTPNIMYDPRKDVLKIIDLT